MSSFTEGFIEVVDYSIYGKCQIQMVHHARFAVFRAKCAPKDKNHSLSEIKKNVFPPSTPVIHQKRSDQIW